MNATVDQAWHYQISSHGAGKFSLQAFVADGRKLDEAIIRDINGWRWPGESRQFRSIEEAAAVRFAEFAEIPMVSGMWSYIQSQFRSKA